MIETFDDEHANTSGVVFNKVANVSEVCHHARLRTSKIYAEQAKHTSTRWVMTRAQIGSKSKTPPHK
jgi:hypothetical protein